MSIAENLKQVLAELPQGVRLVAVSKFHPNEAIEEAYQAGQRIFGESKVQEMTAKYESLPKDIEWHFIGHLQTNKIKYMIPYVAMIHGIDSYKLLVEVNKQAVKAGRTVNCLLQIHVAQEETKFGFSPEECKEMLNAGEWKELTHVRICGLMGMASNTDCIEQINREFGLLNRLFNEIKTTWRTNLLIRSKKHIAMTDLKTTFAGLSLRNPIIISSSGLTNSAGKNKKLAEDGAGAIVLKSLFEEQIMLEADQLKDPAFYPEASDYLEEYIREHKLSEYLTLIKESKKVCPLPIIASINCYTDSEWIDFAKMIEEAGADALEINILALQSEVQYTYGSFEQRHIDILRHIKKTVKIPVIMKLGDNLTNPVALIDQLYANGAAAVVLFNRFYQPDINIEKMEHISGEIFSNASDLATPLRWIGIASAVVDKIDYAASGGVANAESVVKAILAGASAVEVCSAVYLNTNAFIGEANRFLSAWMERKGFKNIAQFKGKLNIKDVQGVNTFERTQFLKYFGKKE